MRKNLKMLLSMLLAVTSLVMAACDTVADPSATVYLDEELYVNEFMAQNNSTLTDSDGEYSDWIEIYNSTDRDIDLTGYYLSDDRESYDSWRFPSVTVKAGSYLLVFASGKNKYVEEDNELHTGFSLSAQGEEICFYTDTGRKLSEITFGPMNADVSYGLGPDSRGGRVYGYYTTPTPGAENAGRFSSSIEVFDPESFSLYINEITARNSYSLYDYQGEYQQWVELINKGETDISLSDFYLSENPERPLKYKLPEVTLKPGEVIVIFISGKGYSDAEAGEYHTNFGMSVTQSELILSHWSGVQLDAVSVSGDMRPNNSLGRSAADFTKWVYYSRPTPGSANSTAEFESLQSAAVTTVKPLYISEAVSVNLTGITASDRSRYDWIELYNPGTEAVSLADYYITKNSEIYLEEQWSPDYMIEPGEYKVIYCGAEEDYYSSSRGEIRLAMSLGANSDTVMLVERDSGYVVDCFETGRQYDGYSAGRDSSGSDIRYYYLEPTPNERNSSDKRAEVARIPELSLDGGYVESGTRLSISAAGENVRILYTTDGSAPDLSSEEYRGELTISEDCVIRAVAVEDGKLPSEDVTRTFIVSKERTLDIVCISTDPDYLFDYNIGMMADGPGWTEAHPHSGANFWKDFRYGAHFEYYRDGIMQIDFEAELSLFGQYSRAEDQKSMKVKLKDKYGISEINYPLIPGSEYTNYSSFVLRSSGQDIAYTKVKDLALAKMVLASELDLDVMDGHPVIVYINGEYWGLYNLRERIDASYAEKHAGYDPQRVDMIKGNSAVLEGSNESYKELLSYVRTHDLRVQEYYDYVCSKVDIDSLINWWVCESYLTNSDTGNIKFYCENSDTGKWRWVFYDLDWAAWHSTYTTERYGVAAPFDSTGHGIGKMFSTELTRALIKNEDFKDRYIHRYAYAIKVVFNPENCMPIFEELIETIEPEIDDQIERWGAPSSKASWELWCNRFRNVMNDKPSVMTEQLQDYFGLSDSQLEHYFSEDENGNPI